MMAQMMAQSLIQVDGQAYDPRDIRAPYDRTFRNAWALDVNKRYVIVDMDLAREIWREKIRVAREPLFREMDTKYMMALETGADTTEIVAHKKFLREAPNSPAIDAAKTPEDLLLVQPLAGATAMWAKGVTIV